MVSVPNDKEDYRQARVFDLAFAVFSGPELQLRFQRFRDELAVFVRPVSLRKGRQSVDMDSPCTTRYELASYLNRNWDELVRSVNE